MKKFARQLFALLLAIGLLVGCQERVAPLGGEFINLPLTLRGNDGSVKIVLSEEGEAGSKTGQVTLFDEATRKAGVLIGTGEISAFDNAGNSYNISGAGNTEDSEVTGDTDVQGNISSSVGAVTITDQLYVTDTATFAKGSGNAIVVSTGGVLEMPAGADISLDGYMNVGDGTPDGSVAAGTDEELYVEGDFEVDGEAEFDGAIDADSTANFGGAVTCSYAGNCLTSGTTADIEWLGFASFGDGTPDGVTDGTAEDVYVEGGLEVDAVIYADGAIDADSTADFADTVTFSKGSGIAATVSAGGVVSFPATADLYVYGYAAVGDGTPDGSVAGGTDEELYVEGDFEVDGEAEFDGAIDADSTANFGGAVTCSYAGNCLTSGTTADIEWLGFASFGDGTADGVTDGTAEDVYVEGGLEVDGVFYADGAIDADSTSDFAGTVTFSKAAAGAIVVSAGGTVSLPATADLYGYGYVAIGDSAPDGDVTAGTDEQLYVEGALEVDGILNADGAINADSTADFADTVTFSKASTDAIVVAAGGTVSLPATSDLLAYGYVVVGDGTPDGAVTAGNDEELYVEGELEVDGTAEFDGAVNFDGIVDMDDTLDVTGNVTVTGDISVTGEVQIGTFLHVDEQNAQTITSGATGAITPTGTYHPITAAGAVGNTMSVSGYTAGDFCILINAGSNTITISDTGTTMLTGDIALGQYDSLTLLFDGTNWVMVSTANN